MGIAGRDLGVSLGARAKMAMKALFYGEISDLVPLRNRALEIRAHAAGLPQAFRDFSNT
jgi:hypothetical protein